jgi:riboflavin kinase/FMN adenylyltransferase
LITTKNIENSNSDTPAILTIGTFDGVHLGHKKIIKKLVESAKRRKMRSCILTFFPHPRNFL